MAAGRVGERVERVRRGRRTPFGLLVLVATAALVGASVAPAGAATTITGLSPATGPAGTSVMVSGTEFGGASAVTFNGTAAAFTRTSATRIRAVVPCGATTGKVAVTTPGGTVQSSGDFTVTAPAPTITTFAPAAGTIGATVTVMGTNLRCVSAVQFNGTPATYTSMSPTVLTATVPPGATTGKITVVAAGGTVQSTGDFVVPGSPTITALSPTSGLPRTMVMITGTNLTGTTAVSFNGLPAVTFSVTSATQIKATVPCAATTGTVSVTTPVGTATSTDPFTVGTMSPPTVTGFSPASSATGSTVTISGTNLTCATSVQFNGVEAAYAVVSGTQIRATVPAVATTGKITVTTPAGSALSTGDFTVPAPTITGFSPASGPVGTTVMITGTGLTGATAVQINGTALTDVTVVSPMKIVGRVATGTSTGRVTVTTPSGTATSTADFSVPAPTVTSFTPITGAVGDLVTITGTGFLGATGATVNGTAMTDVTVVSATRITARVGAGSTTGPIVVTTPAGTGTGAAAFTVA